MKKKANKTIRTLSQKIEHVYMKIFAFAIIFTFAFCIVNEVILWSNDHSNSMIGVGTMLYLILVAIIFGVGYLALKLALYIGAAINRVYRIK